MARFLTLFHPVYPSRQTLILSILALSFALTAGSSPGFAREVTYTRFGADAEGNAAGEIPPFEGNKGLECPDGYQKGDYLPNPYSAEKPLFVITRSNVNQHRNRLSPGQVARLMKHPNSFMKIYTPHIGISSTPKFTIVQRKGAARLLTSMKRTSSVDLGGSPSAIQKTGFKRSGM